MKKIVIIPAGEVRDYLNMGKTYEYIENAFNPGGFFEEVFCISPGGENRKIGKIEYIRANPEDYRKIIKKINPDVVRAYAGYYPCDFAVSNRVEGIPIVVSVHDVNPNLINQSLKYADYIICKSNAVKQIVKEYVDVNEDNIFVSPNRVDIDVFKKIENSEAFKKLNKIYGDGKHILHVGRKTKQKNLETLIKALQYLPLDYNAIFIGPGNSEPYIKLANEYNVVERCFFLDHVSRDSMLPIYYSWCDCMCTLSRWEGFGFVFIEAAACECSIVTSNIAPMNEYLSNGINSILVNEFESPQVVADSIIKACAQNEDVRKMKENARKVGIRFDKNTIDKEEIELYKRIIKKGANNQRIDEINRIVNDSKKIIVFGAGIRGKRVLDYVEKKEIAYFVDNDSNKIGQYIEGIEVIGYKKLLEIYENYRIIVTPEDKMEIVQRLRRDKIEFIEAELYFLLKKIEHKV